MKLVAMLAWFDEPISLLEAAVSSLAGFADHLVAVDGGYELRPAAEPASPRAQAETIRAAASSAGVSCTVEVPTRVWAGQVAKRNRMLELALADGATHVMPLDADWVLRGDVSAARESVAASPADAWRVRFCTPVPAGADLDELAPTEWHRQTAGGEEPLNLVFRALEGIRIERHHWCYSGVSRGRRVDLWGMSGRPAANTDSLPASFWIDHMCFSRNRRELDANRVYCERRDAQVAETGAEA